MSRRYGSIYLITNTITSRQYIGQTVGTVQERFNAHYSDKRLNTYLHNSIRKHGKENFTVEEIAVCFDLESLNIFERELIRAYNTLWPNGYNVRDGGGQGGFCTDIVKHKISQAKRGKPNLKRRGEIRTAKQRVDISRGLGGKPIIGTEIKTGRKTIFLTAQETKLYGFEPWNVVAICKKNGRRHTCHGFVFEYLNGDANQSGRTESKNSDHAQRIDGEPALAEYNPSKSPSETAA